MEIGVERRCPSSLETRCTFFSLDPRCNSISLEDSDTIQSQKMGISLLSKLLKKGIPGSLVAETAKPRTNNDWQEARKFDCRTIFNFVVPRQFSQDIGEWPQNQILIPDWTYFHCPGATLASG